MPYYLYIHNIYLFQYHDTKPNPTNIDWLLGLTPTLSSKIYTYFQNTCKLKLRNTVIKISNYEHSTLPIRI